jgi:hypothetical protein
MENQSQAGDAGPLHNGEIAAVGAAAPLAPAAAGVPSADGFSKTFSSVLNAGTSFMSLAGKEWFSSLLNQPTEPPFIYDAKFDGQFDRVMRLVVVVILLTAIVVGSVGLIADKTAALQVVTWAMKILILAFLIAIVYGLFAFLCGVRVCENEKRRKLTVAQILFTILFIFVPWIPIIAFLWATAASGGPFQLLILTLFFYLCVCYMFLNFVKALLRITACSRLRVWLSVLLPIFLILLYLLSRPTASV